MHMALRSLRFMLPLPGKSKEISGNIICHTSIEYPSHLRPGKAIDTARPRNYLRLLRPPLANKLWLGPVVKKLLRGKSGEFSIDYETIIGG
jgi:hypothetical protein